ncbi:MAG: efflux RND transporter periplasmic adaptor subunit [candidate division Zixibacteria bacterium]|nr:efflux RND transporter periplasmic adaptor subunit [candidate division Zixibacteria bacterium]
MRSYYLQKMIQPLIILSLLLISCDKKEEQSEEIIRPVRFQQVFSTGSSRVRIFSGSAQAGAESKLSFKIAGTVSQVHVKIGDKVKSGQLIAELDNKDYRLRMQEAEAALEQTNAQARNAAAKYDRVRGMYETQNASKDQLDAARTAAESANASVRSMENRFELARLQFNYCRLIAPVDGAIADVNIEENENVRAGDRVVLLTSGSIPKVEISMPEILIAHIRKGDNVLITFDAIEDREFSGKVDEVGVASSAGATTFPVTVRLQKADPDVLPGMIAEVAFNFAATDNRDIFYVPSVAVREDYAGRYLYVVEPTGEEFGIVHKRVVTVGELTTRGLEVIDGLEDSELIVTAGVSKLADGMKVKLPGLEEI